MRIKKIKTALVLIFSLFLLSSTAVLAQEDKLETRTLQGNCNILYKWFKIDFEKGEDVNAVGNLPKFCTAQEIILWVIERFLLFAGSIAVIFLIIGGFRYLTSAGNEEASEKGKKTLVTSIIGLAIILLASAIVRIVANTLGTGSANPSSPTQTSPPPPSDLD